MQKDDLIRQLSCMKQKTMNLLTENDIHALNQVIKLIEDLKKYRKEAKRWKRKYLMLKIEKEKDRITKEERQHGKTTLEIIDKYAEQEPMREFTTEEAKAYSKALDKMYKPTGFNVFNEPCDDAISRKSIKYKLQEKHDFFVNAYGGFSNLPQNEKARVDEITNCIAMVVNEPSVRLQGQTEDAYDKVLEYLKANVDDFPDYHEAIEAVLKMKGGK